MNKGIQSAVIIIFLLVFLMNLLSASPQVRAIKTLNSNINLVWENNIAKPVVPRDEIRRLNVTVEYRVDWGRDFAAGALYKYIGSLALIDLKVTDYSPWCIAALSITTILIPITEGVSNYTLALNIQLKEEAPAFGEGYVKILASAGNMALINGFEKEFTLDFTAGYLPRIDVNLPEGTTKNIAPADSAVFPIEISNLGNARTTVFCTIENLPKGWTAVINDDITVIENGQTTVTLTVKPPKDFGYHDDRMSIMVKLTPARAEDLTNIGRPSFVNVIVQSRGFYTPGFEAITFLVSIVVVMLSIAILRRKEK